MSGDVEKDPPRAPCYEYQNDHISASEFFDRIDATPNDELRELVDRWRSEKFKHDPGAHRAADELEAVIEEADDA